MSTDHFMDQEPPVIKRIAVTKAKVYRWRVGYWISEKKLKKMNFDEFVSIARSANIELIKINLDGDLELQGPYDAILHKLSDLLVLSDQGDSHSSHLIGKLEKFLTCHPEIVVLDPFHCVRRLCDRYQQYTLIQDVCKTDNVCTPAFVDLVNKDVEENATKLRLSGVQYPFVCKPLVAHGSDYAHQMSVIFNEESLRDVDPPCVAQTFIKHNAVLYKVFVLGDRYFVVPRPSLKNFIAGPHPTIFFDSHSVSKEGCSSHLSELEEEDKQRPAPPLLDERVGVVVRDIRRKTDISLFGLDFIVETETGFHYIIDVNNFPSYDGVKYFYNYLVDLIVEALTDKELKLVAEKSSPYRSKAFDDLALALPTEALLDCRHRRQKDTFATKLPPNVQLASASTGQSAMVNLRSSSSKSMSEYLLDSGIGSSSCTESDNSDSERKLLKALRLNQQRYRSAGPSVSQKASISPQSEPATSSINVRATRGGSLRVGAACEDKFATISTPTAAFAERERQLRQEQQQQLAENWSRIKQFYGIPKPSMVKK